MKLSKFALGRFAFFMLIFGMQSFATTPQAACANTVRITLSAQNELVRSLLLRVARSANVSIVVPDSVSGYASLSLRSSSLTDALSAILSPLGYAYHRRGGVYFVEPGVPTSRNAVSGGPVVLPLSVISAKRAMASLRALFPQAVIREDSHSNALVVIARPPDVTSMRSVLTGIDVKNPTDATTEALVLRTTSATSILQRFQAAFPKAKFAMAGARELLITASPVDMVQIKSALSAIDSPQATPPPTPMSSEAVRIAQRSPRDVARALASQFPGVKVAVAGSTVVLTGPVEIVTRARTLVAQLDVANFGDRYTQVYRIRNLDATSVADLLRRSFRQIDVTVDAAINSIAVTASAGDQARIADAIAQLDPPPSAVQGATGQNYGGGSTEVISLKSYVPGQAQGTIDAVTSITQALLAVTPDVKVAQLPTPGQIALIGPPASVRTAKEFVLKVDTVPALVVLDLEVLEVDESVAKNLGLQLGTSVLSSTFTEQSPQQNSDGGPPRLGRFQALSRTPLQFTAQLNLLIQNGNGRVLADPRITTISGRTASIRAGDTISILTTTAGNSGTIATTQVQSFQTGVTLDITPSVTPDGGVMVNLHPVVNSLIGTNNGVPEISTRDTQTTVHLQDDETLVIGGLIQENETRTTTKIPGLGDIPLVGRVFRNDNVQGQRNELIIVVTPHIVKPGAATPGPAMQNIPRPKPLPTLPPNTRLPQPSGLLPSPPAMNVTTPMPTPSIAPSISSPIGAQPSIAPVQGASPTASIPQTNVFTFGSAPQSNFAKPTDPVQIFFATLAPTVVSGGAPLRVAAVTTSNVNAVKLQIASQAYALVKTGTGQWQTSFPFPSGLAATGSSTIVASLIASRADGSSASIPITVNVVP